MNLPDVNKTLVVSSMFPEDKKLLDLVHNLAQSVNWTEQNSYSEFMNTNWLAHIHIDTKSPAKHFHLCYFKKLITLVHTFYHPHYEFKASISH